VVLNLGHFVKQIRNTLKVLNYVAGEGWRNNVDQSCEKYEKYYMESKKK